MSQGTRPPCPGGTMSTPFGAIVMCSPAATDARAPKQAVTINAISNSLMNTPPALPAGGPGEATQSPDLGYLRDRGIDTEKYSGSREPVRNGALGGGTGGRLNVCFLRRSVTDIVIGPYGLRNHRSQNRR